MNLYIKKGYLLKGLLLILASLLLSACNTFSPVKPDFSSLNSHSKSASHQGDLIWIDILSTDVIEAQHFYSALFGWEYVTNDTGYVTIMDNGQAIGGMLLETHVDANSRWMPMFLVADSEQGAAKALEMMGKLPTSPVKIYQNLSYAVISDTEGASFGVMSSPDGIANEAYSANPIVDAQLWSHNRQQSFRFYQPLFSLKMKPTNQVTRVPIKAPEPAIAKPTESKINEPEKIQSHTTMRRIFSSHETVSPSGKVQYKQVKPIFGEANPYKPAQIQFGIDLSMNVIELPWQEIPSQWVISFRVAQANAVLSQVVQNGGDVLVGFDDLLSDGSVAIIEDPSGAVFMIQSNSTHVAKGSR